MQEADRWEESLLDAMIDETVKSIEDSFRGKVAEEDVLIDVSLFQSLNSLCYCILHHCTFQPVVFYFGTKVVQNPVDKIWFYSKLDPNHTFHIKRDQVLLLLYTPLVHTNYNA